MPDEFRELAEKNLRMARTSLINTGALRVTLIVFSKGEKAAADEVIEQPSFGGTALTSRHLRSFGFRRSGRVDELVREHSRGLSIGGHLRWPTARMTPSPKRALTF